ncbi:xin actin-binding repeat-containing protein 1 isoform X1 [Neopelma chrysocephalum]|uniref:xin actin-binding repeat-containing protein 1 isoform X1 n=2 Tax=Neopelma chrysocephalum TaxID=114329 RepID=UPI000FCCEF12|nr:xin actin-binding repeat-containing protein 1 isoform X1 [Neopelma chrysocephalum]XP_027551273.1 xin actin-binding repeat-containing protein 1 isoform X1 [Neopelma chrysocephalum]XP_027551274.1 xin actin-binding repeat-containing protein 1 isoform X1 [Neopelma chrysocephalum]
MEKAEKLRPAQSFPSLCCSPRSNPELRAVLLRKAVSVSELVARYQSILDCDRSMTKQEHPKLMERRYPSQANVLSMGKTYALSPSHPSNMCSGKTMEGVPIPNISAPTRNLKGLLANSDTPKVTPRCKRLHCAPLKTPSPKGLLRTREPDASTMTTIQPLSMETKPHKDPSFLSPLQSIPRKAQWSPATIKWKESSAKEGKLSHERPTIISLVPGTAGDSAPGTSYDRTRSFLDTSDNTIHILHQGRGRSSAPSVKELSALYLSQTAAAAADAGSPAQPSAVKDNSIHSPHRQKKSKMSEAQKSSKVATKKMEDDLPPPPAVSSVQVIAPGSQDLNPLPVPPPKQAFSKFYQQRQVNELKRLYRHMHPELRKNLEEAVTEDLAEMLNTEDPNAQGSVNLDKVLPGEVQSMRWIFENWALDSIGDHQAPKKLAEEEIIPGGDVKSTSLRFESQSINGYNLSASPKVTETDLARGDVRTARWLFETQPLDALNKLYSDETEVQEAVLKEPVQGGDVQGAKQLFEAQSLDAIGRCSSVEEKSILQLKSEIQELKGDVKKTVRLFQTEPLCAIRDKTGTIHEIKSVCREEIQSNAVRTARWLFETQPLDTINKDTSKVQIIRGISLEEIGRPDVSGARWIFETQPLDAIREITVEEQDFKASTDFVTGADVTKQRLLFETQTLDSLKGEASESVVAKEQVIGGDVKSTLWLFETQPMETLRDNFEVGRLKKVELSAEEKGDVKQRKHVFETCPLGSISKAFEEEIPATSVEEVVKGDVKSFKTLFETLPLDSIKQADAEPITKEEEEKIPAGNVKANQILFETTPLYAIKDSFGNFHEVTSVSREQIISGDVKNYKWMFETRPLDQFDESIKKVDIIRGITKQEMVAGDVRTAKWLFETQPMDVIHHKAMEGEEHPSVKREISQRGDVKTCRWLFETQPMHTLYEKAEKKQEEDGSVPQADVKSYTWMFETQPLDSLKGQEEQYLQVSKAYSQEELQGVDVKTVRHLFETEPLGSSTVGEADRKKTMRYSSRVEIQSGEVSRVKEFFEAKPLDTATKPKSQKDAGTIEAGSVHKFTWLFENYPMDTLKDNSEGIQEIPPEKDIKGGDVGGKRFVFETYSLDQIHDEVDETELQKIQKDTMSKANVKSCTMLFESQPLYAIQDKEGGYHEVTSVKKEEIMKGDVKGARWLFETKPLDQIKKEEEVFVIRAVTQEDIKKGDVQAARWRFETEPLDSFSVGKLSVPRTVDDVQRGDVQSNKQLFESQQVGQKKYVRMVSVSDVQRGDVRTSTWLFENHPVDSLYGDAERSSSMSTVQREDSQKGDVKRCTWLFETQPMDTLKDTEVTANAGAQEPIPRADVKSTTWLFESTPLDKFSASEGSIEIELKERTMKETLETLCACQAIQHDGILIEANDMESVKMVKYQLSSPGAPEILKEEVVGGHLQRIMLQLLHRTNVEAQSVLVEEDRDGKIKVSPLQLLDQSEAVKGKEDFSGDVAKALQGLLSQDASIKKGMVLQETKSGSVKMTLYSLLFHSIQQKVVKGDVKSTIGNLLASSQEQKAAATIKREDNEKGNVQLFASCIEKGDLSYLKNLQQESEIQSLINAQAEQGEDESVPRVVQGANIRILPNKEQIGKVIAEGEPGTMEGAKKGFVCESTGREGVLEREAVHAAGVTGTTVQCLGKPLPTVVGKEEILSGGLKVTTKSIQRVTDASKKAEKGEATTAQLKEPKTTTQGTFPTQVTSQGAEVDGKQQSVVSGGASQTQTEEKALGSDLQAAMQSLRLATAEAKNIQHHVQSKFQRNREEVHTACRQQTVSTQGTVTLQSTMHQQDSSSTKQESSSTATRTTTTRVQEASKTHTSVSQKSIASHKKVSASEEVQAGQLLSQESQVVPSRDFSIKDGLYTATPVKTYINPCVESDYKEQSVQEERDVVVRGDVQTAIRALQSAATEQRLVEKEDVVRGNLKATLQSLEKSNVNVSRGDFKAAMIYRNAGQSYSVCKKKNETQVASNQTAVVASGSQADNDFPPPPPVAVMKAEHCPPSTKAAREGALPIPTSKDEVQGCSAPLQTPLPALPSLSCKPSDQSPAEKPRTPPKPEITAPHRKKPVPPPKPEHLSHEAHSASASNSTSRSTKPIPPPLPPKPLGLKEIIRPKTPAMEMGSSCMEVHEQSGYEEVQAKSYNLETSVKKTVTVQGTNTERKVPKYSTKTPLQIAEERYKANKAGQGKVESDSAKISKPIKNGVASFEAKQGMVSGKAAAPRRCPGEVAQRHTELCRDENGCSSLSPPTCPGRAQTNNVPGQTEPRTSPVGHTTPPKRDDTAQNASSKVERESVSNSYGSWDSQRVVQQVHERRQMSHSMSFHQQSMNSFEEQHQETSGQLKCPDGEAETPAQEKPVVVMREKKPRETEDERRKRLSVHKEEIMKGNVKEAMEIFENLRRQEQLQEILTRVREFEEETSKVDVKALKSFFEKVPEWVVHQRAHQAKQKDKAEALEKEDTDSVSSMELVFEDLERASAEIMHLKEQTLARIQDIEEAIKKAIYSVSSLKSESDIAGLSGLFKESLGSTQSSVSSSNIRKISIVSSKAKQEEVTLETGEAASVESAKVAEKTEAAKAELGVPRLIQSRVSSPSSPSYITIESAARKPPESPRTAHSPQDVPSPDCLDSPGKRGAFAQNSFSSISHPSAGSAGHDTKPLEKRPDPVQTKAGLSSMKQHPLGNANHPTSDKEKGSLDTSKDSCHCGKKGSFSEYCSLNVSSPQNPRRQKSILELQTGPDGSKLYGATRTVMEQYEEMDQFGNKIITSSTTVTKQSETQTSSTCDVVAHPQYEVSASPVFRRYLKSPGENFHTNGSFQEPGVVFVTFGNSKPKK